MGMMVDEKTAKHVSEIEGANLSIYVLLVAWLYYF
jgi:hypothetical protein